MRISDWSSDVCSSDLWARRRACGASIGDAGGALPSIRRCRTLRMWVLVGTPASRASSTALSTACSLCCRTRARISTIRSEEHTSELQSLMRISYAVFCLKKKKLKKTKQSHTRIMQEQKQKTTNKKESKANIQRDNRYI